MAHLNNGCIEFLTLDDSYKVKRIRRNPRVICYLGAKDGPAIPGAAEVVMGRACDLAGLSCVLEVTSANHDVHRDLN
jgi:hypothetical protein